MLAYAVMLLYIAIENRFTSLMGQLLPLILAAAAPILSVVRHVHEIS